MLWTRLRVLAPGALAVGIATGVAGVYVRGSQEPASPREGNPASRKPQQAQQPKGSTGAAELPAAADNSGARMRAEQLATRKARALFEIARLTRELAEIAVEEYEEVSYPHDVAIVEGEIKLAESDVARSEDRLKWASRMFEQKFLTPAQKVSGNLGLQKALFALEQAESKRKVLVQYTKDKTIRELRSQVKKACADETAKQAAWDLEKAREIDLERQLRVETNRAG